MDSSCEQLVDSYLAWLKAKMKVSDINGVCEITTPFLDRHNDRLQIYVQRKDGGFLLTDDGFIISDLEICGCGLDTQHRKQLLQTILNGFGVRSQKGELVVEASPENFPQKKHALLQAMMTVNDMFMVASPRVANIFFEDVEKFLEENSIRYTPSVEFTGKSGFVHKFDFVIPKSKKEPERIIRAINHPTRDTATTVIFAWSDTKEVRPRDSQAYVILNDLEKEVSPEILAAFEQYKIETVPWSHRKDSLLKLAA